MLAVLAIGLGERVITFLLSYGPLDLIVAFPLGTEEGKYEDAALS